MPRDGRDERGRIPPDVARFLIPHESTIYAARTEANVRAVNAVLIVVRDIDDPRATPGTAKTIDLAADRGLPCRIVDPTTDAEHVARWLWSDLMRVQLTLAFDRVRDPAATRLLAAVRAIASGQERASRPRPCSAASSARSPRLHAPPRQSTISRETRGRLGRTMASRIRNLPQVT